MQPGERVAGRFEIVGEAARGGMGTVFRARDRRDGRDVALKVLRADAVTQLARFEREAAILAGLAHPNIVEYISHGATPDGLHYLVMAWVEGETLAHRLLHAGLGRGEVIAMAGQLCRALGALHGRGVVHRDVKPSNIMLVGGAAASAVLVDLGIARRAGEAGLTMTGVLIGTAGYVAPELVRRRPVEIDGRADLFALGCVLHECFTGSAAFTGDTTFALCAKVLLHDPPALRTIDPAIPAALEALVSSLLARRPEQRPASAAAVEQALAALGAVPDAGPRRGAPHEATQTISRPEPDRFAAAHAVAAPALCGILIGWPGGRAPWQPPTGDGDGIGIGAGAGAAIDVFDDGAAAVIAAEPVAGVRRALAIAAAMPGATLAVARGRTAEDCIDRCARMLAALELAAQVHGEPIAGVWVERRAREPLATTFRIAAAAGHLRITGEAT